MTTFRKIAASFLLVSGSALVAAPPPAASYKDLKYPALNQVQVPKPTRYELPNGIIVYLLEDHELPMVTMSARIRTGSRFEPKAKAGLAEITGSVMRTGGTTNRSGDDLDKELDRIGAAVETSISRSAGSAVASVLNKDADRALIIMADLLQHPAFPQDKIDLAKEEVRDSISRRNEDAGGIGQREFSRIIYGKDSPYTTIPEYSTLDNIKRADLVAFHHQFFQPENVLLGVWGDFKTDEMKAKIAQAFGSWARGGQPRPVIPKIEKSSSSKPSGVYFINKDDVNQSSVFLGRIGGRLDDPDYPATELAAEILGGGFGSRLFDTVRSDMGLAYSVSADWGVNFDYPGVFEATGGTKSESTAKMIQGIQTEMRKLRTGNITDTEFAHAKDTILKGTAFDFDSTDKVMSRLMTYEYYGYPPDTLQRFQEGVKKATKADIAKAAQQYLDPTDMPIVVVGNKNELKDTLKTFGPITEIDVTIPKANAETIAPLNAETSAQGKKLIAQAREALGGAAVTGVKDYTQKASMSLITPQGEMAMQTDNAVKLPNMARQSVGTPMGTMLTVFNGNKGWMKAPNGTQELPPSAAAEAMASETLVLMATADQPGVQLQALGSRQFAGKPVDAVLMSDAARKISVKFYLDPQTHLMLGKAYDGDLMGAPGEIEEVYSDYREVNGVRVPFHIVLQQNGQKRGEVKVSEMKINTGVADTLFAKP